MVKVIFIQNIDDHKVGDIKNVSEGYARNFLFKKKIAEIATKEKIKELETKISKIKKEEESIVKEVEKLAEKLIKETVQVSEEVNEEGHLYGSVGAKEIADEISKLGYEVDGADIIIEEPIKDLGKHNITVRLGHGVETEVTIDIIRK